VSGAGTTAGAIQEAGSMMLEQTVKFGCGRGSRDIKPRAEAQTKGISIFATAASGSADGAGSGRSEAGGKPVVAKSGGGGLSSGNAREDVERDASTGGSPVSSVRNVTSCVTSRSMDYVGVTMSIPRR
jgi:hypothetical protein